jgi:hypothetical protein
MPDGIVVWILLAVILMAVARLLLTHRRYRRQDRGDRIQRELKRLRKKRDEE